MYRKALLSLAFMPPSMLLPNVYCRVFQCVYPCLKKPCAPTNFGLKGDSLTLNLMVKMSSYSSNNGETCRVV